MKKCGNSFVRDDASCMADVLVNSNTPKTDNLLMFESLNKDINRMLNTLTERENTVIKLFFGIGVKYGLSLDQIAEKQRTDKGKDSVNKGKSY